MRSRFLIIFCLIFAGELIFSLPFHVARFFRPTVLSVFNLSNADLGDIFSVFGVTATIVYFPGGALADHFSARKLMTISLLATAVGGLYMATIPSHLGLSLLFGYWGVTCIFLFWAAMIKATRDYGGSSTQGSAFGILDGGRGLVAAGVATVAVYLMGSFLPTDVAQATEVERQAALRNVIYFYSAMTSIAALFVWLFVPDSERVMGNSVKQSLAGITELFKQKSVLLQAAIVVCAYCAYKGLDNYAVYVVDVLKMNQLEAAQFTSYAAYLRPLSAVAAGFLADRFLASRVISSGFMVLAVIFLGLSFLHPDGMGLSIIYGSIIISFCAVFALRGVYFALLEEAKTSNKTTGAAVGLISLIGFTPDIFFGALTGRIIDASPGIEGYQNYFMVMIGIAVIGFFATMLFAQTLKSSALKDSEVSTVV